MIFPAYVWLGDGAKKVGYIIGWDYLWDLSCHMNTFCVNSEKEMQCHILLGSLVNNFLAKHSVSFEIIVIRQYIN